MKKYLAGGEEVDLIQEVKRGYLVQCILETCDYDGDPIKVKGRLEIVDRVFDAPPRQRLDEEMERTKKKMAEIEAGIEERMTAILEQEKQAVQRMKKLAKYEKLKRLEDFLDGKLTHLVIHHYAIYEIVAAGDAKCNYDKHKLRLLSLLGDSKGDIEWRLGYYSDGSGSNVECTPCTSYEEAQIFVQAVIDKGTDKEYERRQLINTAEKHGLKVPQDWIDQRDAADKAEKEKMIKKIEAELAEAKAA